MIDAQEMELSDSSMIRARKDIDKSRVKIAQVISRLCIGGTPVAVILAAEFLRNKGYSVDLLAGNVTGDEASMEDFAIRRGVQPVRVRSLTRVISPWSDLKSLWQLIRYFRLEKPTIVHTHTAKAGVLGRIAARLAGVPICVHTFHGHVFCGHFSASKSRIYLEIERILARWTDCLVAVSPSQGDELVEKYRIASASKFVTIPVAFDSNCYTKLNGYRGAVRRQFSGPAASPLIGWVGRLTPIKDPELFLDTAAFLLGVYPEARFAIVGDGELRGYLERLLNEKKIADKIKLIGWQSDMSDFYADIDVLVMTSKHEGVPLALLEAMASGKPFVSTNVGGIKDLMTGTPKATNGIEIFKNGILTDSSTASLAAGMEYLLDHPERAREMGRAGRAFVSSAFANDHSAAMLENLYLTLLQRSKIA